MMLILLVLVPLLGGLAAWLLGRRSDRAARVASLVALAVMGGLALAILAGGGSPDDRWLDRVRLAWLPDLGSALHLGVDGLSLPLVLLTVVLGLVAVLASWTEITRRVGFFHLNLLAVLAGVVGVFLALDLLVLYLFWELMLIPMALLIAVWGHEHRRRAAVKFVLFTQAAGLAMLVAIVALALAHREAAGVLTFDYPTLLAGAVRPASTLMMLGFVVAFAVKLPAVPLHTWLPEAHTEAPTAGSVVLAGLLLKTGAYGLLRFAVPLFPDAAVAFAPWGLGLGVAGILWGAWLALGQRDLKRLVAYTSVSHMGFVLLGVYAFESLAWRGVLLQMIAHGLSTGGLFVVAGLLQKRTGTRDLAELGGLWSALPRLGGLTMVLVMASLGLPGLANFVAEFLVLLGAFRAEPVPAILAALGLVAATAYALWLMQRAFHGRPQEERRLADLGAREVLVLGACVVVLVWLGLFPQPVLDLAGPPLDQLRELAAPAVAALGEGSLP